MLPIGLSFHRHFPSPGFAELDVWLRRRQSSCGEWHVNHTLLAPRSDVRYGWIDIFKFVAAAEVLILHALPRPEPGVADPSWAFLIGSICRAAVPFFFVVSGFFLRIPERFEPSIITRPLKRLLPIFLGWMLIYDVAFSVFGAPYPWHPRLSDLWTGGIAFQLWFLPVLGASQVLVAAGTIALGRKGTLLICFLIALVGWVTGPYASAIHFAHHAAVNRGFFGPFLVGCGLFIREKNIRMRSAVSMFAFLASLCVSLAENSLIADLSGSALAYNESTLGPALLGISALMIGLSIELAVRQDTASLLGKLSLGVYCIHVLFLWPLIGLFGNNTVAESMSVFVGLLFLSGTGAYMLLRTPLLRHLVI